ncbi:endonuclease NucS [Glaesserella parasuis]|uniref:endonuclease NucS domain-containing protein n=2 Tax=Glaesserella parasuis TaxID=738 RepID=UPI00041D1E6E|nr:endonuclease NucS domain-containing protein [Glaesserella parasuis]MDD2174153.1 endonuclease NucS [Glaesserella parasuis]MDG6293894.1 endonuclease NucS [Glaesserella parasuis]MDG6858660.1 endonuclease NucS [Glaesserella parasuis]MDO9656724.1 endonuclease NucS [Glaesserella parasuis]MDO9667904.1 endonuclease NucS [Glaesserella parasuis]
MQTSPYPSMKISHNIVEHLGLKLYQNKPTNVIAELVSNAWDANATELKIDIVNDETNKFISVNDNGCGMDIDVLKNTYLVIGKSKYNTLEEQREISKNTQRKPMGRKGIGKLAPFGICRQMHVITVKDKKINWLRFSYDEMITIGKTSSVEQYRPDFIIFNKELSSYEISNIPNNYRFLQSHIHSFLDDKKNTNTTGTLIILTELKLKKAISPKLLVESIGQRFTVTLNRPDFKIYINNTLIDEKSALPTWELRIPSDGTINIDINVNGELKPIKYWIGFVKEAEWPTEHAGIGIYAHGKIAQDRPFFFKVQGREILSRYMYGVIEADFIEELEEDLISTDRTSINWENSAFEDFFTKGQEMTRKALDQYLEHRKNSDKEENTEIINSIVTNNKKIRLNEKEKSYLSELLNDITPSLGKDKKKKEEVTEALAKSWTNEPSRRMVKKLWNDVKENSLEQLHHTLLQLSNELVPQSLNLTRTFAQRVFALTKLKERIEAGKETPLQELLEDFPWIISHTYEKFTQRQSLTTVINKAKKEYGWGTRDISLRNGRTQPDFVFLGTSNDLEFLVIELKANDTANYDNFAQLRSYVEFLEQTYSSTNVKGILIARSLDKDVEKKVDDHSSLEFMSWDTLLKRSRQEYITFLTALLLVTDENPQDAIDWGGKEIEEFLQQMAQNDEDIKAMMDKYNQQIKSAD